MRTKLHLALGFAFILGTVPLAAIAQEEASLNLKQAQEIAYKNNKGLLITLEKIIQAQGKFDETVSNLYPILTFDLAYNRSKTSFTAVQSFDSESLDKKVSLSQPLYTGNRTVKGINVSQHSLENSKDDYKKGKIDTNLSVTKAYYDLLKAQKLVDVAQGGVTQAQSHLDVVNRQLAGALGGRAEVVKANARVQLLTNQQNLVKAEQSREISTYAFANALGIPKENVPSVADEELPFPLPAINLEEGLALSKNRIEFGQLKRTEEIARLSTEITQENWSYSPTVMLVGNYNWKDFTAMGTSVTDWAASVDAKWILWDGNKTPSQVIQNESQRKQSELTYRQVEENVMLEVNSAYLTLISAEKQLEISKEATAAAQLNLNLANDLFRRGVGTDADVRDAETANLQAQTNFVTARYDYLYALAAWKKAIGTLL